MQYRPVASELIDATRIVGRRWRLVQLDYLAQLGLAEIEGKVPLSQDVRQFPFKAVKDEKHRMTTRKDEDSENS